VSLKDRTYTIELDHFASEPASFELRTPWKIEAVEGAQFEALTSSSYRLTIAPAADKRTYRRHNVAVTFSSND
jgi:hypothetical protein